MAPQSFNATTAIITGGASGIGRALGAALATAGARVVLADVDGHALARTIVELRAYLRRLHQKPMPVDKFAQTALRDISRNKAISVIPRSTKTLWYLHRLSPSMTERLAGSMAKIVAKDLVRPVPRTGMDT